MKVKVGPPWCERLQGLPSWFSYGTRDHEPEIELTWDMLQELYDAGCNVMLFHASGGENVLFVDSRCFTQR